MSRGDTLRILGRWGGKYTVRRFRLAHLGALSQRGFDVVVSESDAVPGRRIGFTIFKGEDAVACVGVRHIWGAVGEGWVLTSALVNECPKLLHMLTLRGLEWLERRKGYRRIGARVLVDFVPAQEWALRLGFMYEGMEPMSGPNGESFFKYGRLAR